MMFGKIDKGQWWDRALTLVEGCTPVSEGCDNCWSAAMAHRFGSDLTHKTISERWPNENSGKWTGNIVCRGDRLALPLKVKKPTAWAVWNDLFHEDVPWPFIYKFFEMTKAAPQHIFLVLTKRPQLAGPQLPHDPWPKNVWIGVTAENQEQADKRIPILLQIPAAVRFVSVEPMLGPVDLTGFLMKPKFGEPIEEIAGLPFKTLNLVKRDKIHWVICGCESGPKARPMHSDWVVSLRDQCQAAGVPFFLKQMRINDKMVKAPFLDGKPYLQLPTDANPYLLDQVYPKFKIGEPE